MPTNITDKRVAYQVLNAPAGSTTHDSGDLLMGFNYGRLMVQAIVGQGSTVVLEGKITVAGSYNTIKTYSSGNFFETVEVPPYVRFRKTSGETVCIVDVLPRI